MIHGCSITKLLSNQIRIYCIISLTIFIRSFQIGFTNWIDSIMALTTFNGKTYVVNINHNVHDTAFIDQILREELDHYQKTSSYISQIPNESQVIYVIKEFDGVVEDGSVIGFGMTEGHILVITIDGHELGKFAPLYNHTRNFRDKW